MNPRRQALAPLRKQYAVADREPILIHPKDAVARGIENGSVVRVFNERGQILAGAVVTDDIIEGAVRVCEGAWYDPVEPGVAGTLCKNGRVNVLTRDIPTSNLAMGNCGQSGLVEIEPYKDTPPPLTAFTRPKGAAA